MSPLLTNRSQHVEPAANFAGMRSEKTRQHDELLLLVRLGELFAKGTLLALAPAEHVGSADGDEEDGEDAACGDDDANPRHDLKHVVGAGHQAGSEALGNAPLGAAPGAQAGEVQVHDGIADLANDEDGSADVLQQLVIPSGRDRPGRVDLQGAEEARCGPVEEGVPDNIPGGHGGGGELVDKQCLYFALDEVTDEEDKGEDLSPSQGHITAGVDIGTDGHCGDVEQDGAEVLDEEDGPPSNLVAWVRGTLAYRNGSILACTCDAYQGPSPAARQRP